jgi:hypothetical protein
MEEGLIPDLAPNLYSQGKIGTGYAQVFDTGAPNPFAVTQDYINQSIANKKEAVKTAVANEEKRQEKLDEFLASIDDIDQPWNVAKDELGKKINDYGELISKMRAQGTPINSAELTKAQKELKDLAKVNESNYQKAMKIGTEMQDPLIYTKEESDAFQKEIKDATLDADGKPKEGGIYEVQKVLDKWQKGIASPQIVSDFVKTFRPPAKDMKGKEKATLEADFKQAVSDQFDSYNNAQLKKLLKSYQESGKISDDYKLDQIDAEDEEVLNAIKDQMTEDLKPYKEYDKIQGSSRGGGYHYTTKDEDKLDNVSFYNHYNFKEGYLHGARLQTTRSTEFEDINHNPITLIPSSIVSGDITKDKKGWALTGRQVAQRGARYDTEEQAKADNPGELVEFDPTTSQYVVVKQGKNVTVPLTQANLAALEAMGFKNIMQIWKREYVKKGGSGEWFDNEIAKTFAYGDSNNSSGGQIQVADPTVLDQDPNKP